MPRFSPLFLAACLLAGAPAARSAEVAATPAPAATAPSLVTAADLFNLKQVESPALSPDGQWVVYVVRSIEPKPDAKDDWVDRTQLWLAAVDGKTPPRQLTFGSAGNSSPVWAPQGGQFVFVRSVEKEKPQIFLLSLAGGEALPLTKLDTGASRPRWSPDGSKIMFTSTLSMAQMRGALEKAGRSAAPPWANEKPGRKPNDTANWGLKKKDDKQPPRTNRT